MHSLTQTRNQLFDSALGSIPLLLAAVGSMRFDLWISELGMFGSLLKGAFAGLFLWLAVYNVLDQRARRLTATEAGLVSRRLFRSRLLSWTDVMSVQDHQNRAGERFVTARTANESVRLAVPYLFPGAWRAPRRDFEAALRELTEEVTTRRAAHTS